MSGIDDLVRRHLARAEQDERTRPGAAPSLHVTLLTCMDTRINVYDVFGLEVGEVHVLRNAGGIVTDDVIRSLAISQRELGTREVIVMQHTTCGMMTITDDGFKDAIEADTGLRPTWAVEAFQDVKSSVRQSVERVRRSPFVPHRDNVRGFVYDVGTGSVEEVLS
jgi:carbonic anhydrase